MQPILLYIKTVYECGSFVKAANKLFVTPPALTIAIRKEEESLGTQLFDRNFHPIKLTPAGKIYLKSIQTIELAEQERNHAIKDLNGLQSGFLRLGGTQFINAHVLPPVLAEFINKYPYIDVKLNEAPSEQIGSLLREGSIDVMFNANPLSYYKDFKRTPAFKDHMFLAVPKAMVKNKILEKYALSYSYLCSTDFTTSSLPDVPIKLFKDTPMVLLTPGNFTYNRSLEFCHQGNFEPRTVLSVDQMVSAYHLACAGVGATFVSEVIVKAAKEANIVFFKMHGKYAERIFYSIVNPKCYISAAAKEFLRIFHKHY